MTRKRSLVRGFTLMEVMVAVGITALMGGLVAASFTSSFNAREVVQKEADRYRMIRTAFSRMSREIGAAYVSDRYDAERYRDQNDRPSNFIGERDKLTFTWTTDRPGAKNWIGVYGPATAPGSGSSWVWTYVQNAASGTTTVDTHALAGGPYRAYLLLNDGNEILAHKIVNAVSFGAPFIANPDLVERFAQGHPLADGDRDTYYAGHAEGYTDYPAFTAN